MKNYKFLKKTKGEKKKKKGEREAFLDTVLWKEG